VPFGDFVENNQPIRLREWKRLNQHAKRQAEDNDGGD
jgi:hypothetical protein